MAYAREVYLVSAPAGQSQFDVPFPYLQSTHVKVQVDGVAITNFSFVNPARILLPTPAALGATVVVYRETSPDVRLVDYQTGSVLSEEILDLDSQQGFYLAQEANDVKDIAIIRNDFDQWGGDNRILQDIADPVDAQDAATKHYLEEVWLTPSDKAKLNGLNLTNLDTVAGSIANVNTTAGSIANVNTTATNITNVNKVAAVDTKVTTVANNDANVTTVANNIASVNTAAGSIASVNTTAGAITNVNTVATNVANVNTVAGINANVTSVANNVANIASAVSNATNINAVVANAANINTVAGNNANVTKVATIDTKVTTVANNDANVSTVAGISGNVTTVAGISGNVTTVATNNANVTTVATNIANVNSVAGNATNINAVAANATNINAVNTNKTNIDAVAGNSANINAVAGNSTNINAVNANSANINAVNANSANINTVAGINASVSTVAGNIAAILDAPNQASAASASAVAAASSAATAAALLDNFDDRYLGPKTSDPGLDNDGNALVTGALYFNTTDNVMKIFTASGWIAASAASVATLKTFEFVATAGQTVFSGVDANGQSLSFTDPALMLTLNGVRLRPGDDYTTSAGTSITLLSAASLGDELVVDAFGNFLIANVYTKAESDALVSAAVPSQTGQSGKYLTTDGTTASWGTVDLSTKVSKSGDTMTGTLNLPSNGLTVGTNQLVVSGTNVGIGTSSPSGRLHVASSAGNLPLYVTSSAASQNVRIRLNSSDTTSSVAYVWSYSDASLNKQASIYFTGTGGLATQVGQTAGSEPTSGTLASFIDSSGNVGIGTSSPGSKLDVVGTITTDGLTSEAANGTITSKASSGFCSFTANTTAGSNAYVFFQQAGTEFGRITAENGGALLFSNGSGATERMRIDSSGNLLFNSGYGSVATSYGCRAWVNFNGTGAVAIRASGNVSSITDNGTANYTVNFTTAMPDTNYCIVASGTNAESMGPYVLVPNTYADVEYAPTTTSCRVGALVPGVSWAKDQKYAYVSIFR